MRLARFCLAALLITEPAIAAPTAERDKAFLAAFGHGAPYTMTASGGMLSKRTEFIYTPSGLVNVTPGIVALVSKGKLVDFDCHACFGTLAIHYLKQDGKNFSLLGAWPAIGGAAPYGEAAAWAVRKDLDNVPVLVTTEDDGGQGCYQTWSDLIALTPVRPVVRRANLPMAVRYDPGPEPDHSPGYDVKAKLVPGKPGQDFALQYTGTWKLKVEYHRKGDVYLPATREAPAC